MVRGGKRVGSGRPIDSGKYREKTVALRIPQSVVDSVKDLIAAKHVRVPLYLSKVNAGFPSPADEHVEKTLDLHSYLVRRPAATFFVRVKGNSMEGVGIFENDLLIVDKSLEPRHNHIVIAVIEGELTVKRLSIVGKKVFLKAENPEYPLIEVQPERENSVWGVVIHAIHSFNTHGKK
jgi:DNA polymerase V